MTEVNTADEAGIVLVHGKQYMPDARGNLVPLENIKPQHRLEDEAVRKVIGFARDLSAQIERFKTHTVKDLSSLDDLLAQHYQVTRGGKKGNRSYFSQDGLLKVQVAMADQIVFGAELQQAKALIDECLLEWTDEGRTEIRAIVLRAFSVDREGQINKAELLGLLRLEIGDERWQRAMQAIRDAIRVVGAKQYVRFYQRPDANSAFRAITIDLAQA